MRNLIIDTSSNTKNGNSYAIVPTKEEEARLHRQGDFWGPRTRQLFEAAGIGRGMKVLDLGSGVGDVALLAAQLVGPTGCVVGIDINDRFLNAARARANQAGLANVSFVSGDVGEVLLEDDFDAMVGRLILCHLPDPAAVLRRVVPHLRTGGIAVFHEPDLTQENPSDPPCVLHRQATRWIRQGCAYGGVDIAMGAKLHQTFLAAGFEAPQMRVDALMGGSRTFVEQSTWYGAETVRAVLPLLVKGGIATEEEVGIETLATRWRDQLLELGSVMHIGLLIGAWARKAQV